MWRLRNLILMSLLLSFSVNAKICNFHTSGLESDLEQLSLSYERHNTALVVKEGYYKPFLLDAFEFTYDGPSKGYDIYETEVSIPGKSDISAIARLFVYPKDHAYFPGEVHLVDIRYIDGNGEIVARYHNIGPDRCVIDAWPSDWFNQN